MAEFNFAGARLGRLMKDILKKIMAKNDLSYDEINFAVEKIAHQEVADAQIGAFLTGITFKGVSADEFFAFASSMRRFANRVITDKYVVDSCGTGADMSGTINISTSASIVANAFGVNVVKQTNSSITSACGSTDFLHNLGIKINRTPDDALDSFNKFGITFVHSPYFNDFAKVNNPIRQQIGIKTIFNYLGPLINPSFPDAQLLGVSSNEMCDKMAYALQKLGTDRALVVNGLNPNLDEISLCSETRILELKCGNITENIFSPKDFGFQKVHLSEIQGGNGVENARIVNEIFAGKRHGAMYDIISLNAGAMIYLSGLKPSIKEGIDAAQNMIDSGKVFENLIKLQSFKTMAGKEN